MGGVFVIQVPSTGWLSELIFGKYHYGHLRYYDENYLRTYLEDRGFYIEYIQTFNSVPFSSLLSMVCGVVPHIIYPYYGSVTAIAKKRVKK